MEDVIEEEEEMLRFEITKFVLLGA